MKYCPKCNRDLPNKSFHHNKGRYDGFQSYCIDCKRKASRKRYDENPFRYNYTSHIGAMKYVLKVLGKKATGLSLGSLYNLLVKTVLQNPKEAQCSFPNGKPDALKLKVEFKVGLDSLKKNQLVWNILNGHEGRVRWFPSYDALEGALSGYKSKGKLFRSYKEFILWKYGQ